MIHQIKVEEMEGVLEEVDEAISVVAQNLIDEKTDQLKPRAVNLKLIFQRVVDKQGHARIVVSYQIKNDLQPRTEHIATCEIDEDGIIGQQPTLFPAAVD